MVPQAVFASFPFSGEASMFPFMRRIVVAAAFGLAILSMNQTRALAQNPFFQVRPGLTLQQWAFNLGTAGRAFSQIPPYALGFNPYVPFGQPALSSFVNPYAALYSQGGGASSLYGGGLGAGLGSGYGGYGGYGGYYEDPFGAYLRGSADVIKNQGQFMINQQQAFSMREQARQDMIATRRKNFDEYLYEREKAPTPEEDRERYMRQQLARSRNNPPPTEVWSGKALNDLLADLQQLQAQGDTAALRTFQVPLDEDNLKRVNVSPSENKGNIGLLRDSARLNWPVALSGPEFKEPRERTSSLVQEAAKQAEFNNQVDPGVLRQLRDDASRMRAQLRRNGVNLPPDDYIEGKNFLDNLDSAITALRQPDVGNFFTGRYAPKGKTVQELIRYMTQQGLRFAPAVPGEEAQYLAIYQALLAYDNAARPATAER
jgi:hypothetical protein